jgi:hypothetical protein
MSSAGGEALGLIAGSGSLPLEIARAARRRGRGVLALGFPGHTDARLEGEVPEVVWLSPGRVGAALEALRAGRVREAVLAGKLPKELLYQDPERLELDGLGREALGRLPDRRDGSLLSLVAETLHGRGIHLLPQAELVPELLPGEGPLGALRPTPAQSADIAFGWPVARALAGLDVGQVVVVKDRAVLAVEALEGTDAAIRRAGRLAPGAVAVKVARPNQDPRFDLPVIGPGTLAALREARAGALAFEAGRTLVLERAALVQGADAAGIALLGVAREPAAGGAP